MHPLDAQLGLPARCYSYELQRRLVLTAVHAPFDDAVRILSEMTGVAIPKRSAEQIVIDAAVDFDAFYAQRTTDDPILPGDVAGRLIDGLQSLCFHPWHSQEHYIFSSVDLQAGGFDPQRYWRGPVWLNTDWSCGGFVSTANTTWPMRWATAWPRWCDGRGSASTSARWTAPATAATTSVGRRH